MQNPTTEMTFSQLEQILEDASLAGNITTHSVKKIESATFTKLPDSLHPVLVRALCETGIKNLYVHQREALAHIASGQHTLISTGVASGKSLCYQLPLLNQFLEAPATRALLLFPTKALGNDQKENLQKLLGASGIKGAGTMGVYDGDLPAGRREAVRNKAAFVFSNPDMLHLGILPHHTRWAGFFKNLKYVVVDEVHMYHGVFGSHFANVLRRFQRIAGIYHSNPHFIVTSATLTGGREFVEKLFEVKFATVEKNTSACGEKHFLIYNPPLVNRELGIRRPAAEESLRLARKLLRTKGQTLIFAHTRKAVELLLTELRNRVGEKGLVCGYRSGYLPHERRDIEQKLRRGEIRTVVTTNALELGIDIGGIDTVIMSGYPGSITSTKQQTGRAGRKGRRSLAIFVASGGLMDQYLVKHPEYLLDRNPEQALINPDNPYILLRHLQCAIFEKAFTEGESFGNLCAQKVREFMQLLEKIGRVHKSRQTWFWASDGYPANEISLRTAASDTYILQNAENVVGLIDRDSAFWFTHPGAVYLHNGESYQVSSLNLEKKTVSLKPFQLSYYTQAVCDTRFELMETYEHQRFREWEKFAGQLKVETRVTGFKKLKWHMRELLGREELDLPPSQLITAGCWFVLGVELVNRLRQEKLWNNDANRYGHGWEDLAASIRERDRYRCTNCGESAKNSTLHVHHKLPLRSFSSSALANRPENLISLCPVCHTAAEKQIYIQSGLAGLTYLLGRLAPFSLLCSGTDLHIFGEARSAICEDQPAVIFYDSAPGGVGLSEKLYSLLEGLFNRGLEVVSDCECRSGCPACVGPEAENGVGAKAPVAQMLKYLTAASTASDQEPA